MEDQEINFPIARSIGDDALHDMMREVANHEQTRQILLDIKERIANRPKMVSLKRMTYNPINKFPHFSAFVYNNVIRYLEYKGYVVRPLYAHTGLGGSTPVELTLEISWSHPF